jgi:hypothetical protein
MRSSILILALLAAGCGSRLHLTTSHGRAHREAFGRQVANPAGQSSPPRGLDAQEAAAIVSGYRGQLAPRGGRSDEQPMLLVAPQPAGSLMPAPSVPPAH